MPTPQQIQELEKELNTTFEKVDVQQIMNWTIKKNAQYATDPADKIIGLHIENYGLEQVPKNINEFKDLQFLNLGYNQISDISAISNLRQLTQLDLDGNKISDISAISNLRQLTKLNLSWNKISDISAISNLKQLTILRLGDNQISDISAISNLKQLTILSLGDNQISDISAISNLTKLKRLTLESNKINDISAISNLKQLSILDLRKNPIEKLPKWICNFPEMDIQWKDKWYYNYISFYGNPLKHPPIEIVKQGKEAILNYFKEREQSDEDYLYEAKLILVGEERAGKSTIAKALSQNNFKINLKEDSTKGIDILEWLIPKEKTNTPKGFRFNIWDFGGQDIYRATHQFFLTKRSLYLFVTEARKDLRFDEFYYWLNIINALSGNSPIIATKNKIDQSSASNDITEYKKLFPQLVGSNLFGISCNTEHKNWESEYKPLLNI